MTASAASTAKSAKFGIKGDGSSYVYVAEVKSITPPGRTRGTKEVTHLDSPDGYKEFIAEGFADGGEASITINYVPAVSDALVTAFENPVDDFSILAPDGTKHLKFKGIVTAYEPGEMNGTDEMTATFTVKVTGKAAWEAVA